MTTLTPTPPLTNEKLVRAGLTRWPKKVRDNEKFAAAARRFLRALARRVAGGDIEGIALLLGLAVELATAIQDAVNGLRAHGFTWDEIAARAGIKRQTAWERWGKAGT